MTEREEIILLMLEGPKVVCVPRGATSYCVPVPRVRIDLYADEGIPVLVSFKSVEYQPTGRIIAGRREFKTADWQGPTAEAIAAAMNALELHCPSPESEADRMCREGYARLREAQASQPQRQGASHRQREAWPIHGGKAD